MTTAATPRRKAGHVSYLPTGGTITVDMARLAGPVRARWFDPTNGTYIAGLGLAVHEGRHGPSSRRPGKNADGDRDWVLVLGTA